MSLCIALLILFVVLSPFMIWTRQLATTNGVNLISTTFGTGPLIASYTSNAVSSFGGAAWGSSSLWYGTLDDESNNACKSTIGTSWGSTFCQNGSFVLPTELVNINITLWVTFVCALLGGFLGFCTSRGANLLAGFLTLGGFISSVLALSFIGQFSYYQELRSNPPQNELIVFNSVTNSYYAVQTVFGFAYGPSFYVLIVSCIMLFFVMLSMFAAARQSKLANEDLSRRYNEELEKDPELYNGPISQV